ncbi:MAG: phosphoadenosine phosphosulfate reductase family protein [Candidatus Heimdallarchaeota archaeon]|nr:phosphoadenosine phosphosulfate reductase family protein [Candidatus Heimdallarchaeota archaeon]MCG3255807.1 phosphoadenosine phosphosulfate reductase family protein [Candidatus Heimdallarchaeota archaeon]MCK4610880.1 phosphoadenosine phosphosulfate reductase family protein [Candidatus Heimdallarchaeota archaeon]
MNKIEHAKDIIRDAVRKNPKIAVACSFGKDSMATVDIAREVAPNIPIFSVMTFYKPKTTFKYLLQMNEKMDLDVHVYMVADEIPEILSKNKIKTTLLSTKRFNAAKARYSKSIYEVNPDLCCKLLKVDPTKEAVKDLDAWISGLRNTEGVIRKDYHEIEHKGGLVKINPILSFTEKDVLDYLKNNDILLHPWYLQEFPDGRKYRSLGCEPCTKPISTDVPERMGRWQSTNKCAGECGIHTQILKN